MLFVASGANCEQIAVMRHVFATWKHFGRPPRATQLDPSDLLPPTPQRNAMAVSGEERLL